MDSLLDGDGMQYSKRMKNDIFNAVEAHSCVVISEMSLVEQDTLLVIIKCRVFRPEGFVNCLQDK